MRVLLFLVAFGLCISVAHSQTSVKVGYVDVDYVFANMPEVKKIDADLQSLQAQLKKNLDAKIQEFQGKYAQYQQNSATMVDVVRQNTERELQQLQLNIEKLQRDSEVEIQKKQMSLMEPVYTKIGKVIEYVAKENGYTFVVNQKVGGLDVILYADPSVDVSNLVLNEMGITPSAPAIRPAR